MSMPGRSAGRSLSITLQQTLELSMASTMTPARPHAPKPPVYDGYDSRRWRALPVVLSATFMALFDVFVVNVAAPSIQHDLNASSETLELIVAAYSFTYTSDLVT